MCCLCLNACIGGTITKNIVNPSRGRDLEGISGTEGLYITLENQFQIFVLGKNDFF